MDETTIELIIVTAVINAFVTGVIANLIFYRYQKNIDLLMSQTIEKFKTDLQLSNFEEQTKFARNHEKTVNLLESLCQRFTNWKLGFIQILSEAEKKSGSRRKVKTLIDPDKFDEYFSGFASITDYFSKNRYFLPDDIVRRWYDIESTVQTLLILTQAVWQTYHDKGDSLRTLNARFLIHPYVFKDLSILGIRGIEDDNFIPNEAFEDIITKIHQATFELEGLYKEYAGFSRVDKP